MSPPFRSRRTRFVCVSDTHTTFPKLPQGDVLIHAGDLTNQGTLSELQRTVSWLERAPFDVKIVVAGNHDITLDQSFHEQYGSYFQNQTKQNSLDCIALLKKSTSITYLNHESRTIWLSKPGEPRITFKVFGSPYSPSRGLWAFGYAPEDAHALWNQIPLDTDIVVTHTPPKYHCDESYSRGSAGCENLRQALWRVRPRMAVCGHVHEGRGMESVLWDLHSPNVKYKEAETYHWEDTTVGTKKQFRVDLTHRSQRPLRNNGEHEDFSLLHRQLEVVGSEATTGSDGNAEAKNLELLGSPEQAYPKHHDTLARPIAPVRPMSPTLPPATHGQGGPCTSGRCDVEALLGRGDRQETCIVNAAIMGTSWPHKTGKKFNKPIVVDIDLPITAED